MIYPFVDLPNGVPGMPESIVLELRKSLDWLIGDLQNYDIYQGEESRFGCGLLLLLPIRKVFELFQNEDNFHEEKKLWEAVMKSMWERIPGSGKILLPHQG